MKKILLAYVPVLHNGYIRFFNKYKDTVDCLYVIGEELIDEFTFLEKEIRAIKPETIKQLVDALAIFKSVKILDNREIKRLSDYHVIAPREGISERIIGKYFKTNEKTFDSVFLRWDEKSVSVSHPPKHIKISTDTRDRYFISLAEKKSQDSSDWWRQVGAVLTKDDRLILTGYNHHLPNEHTPYAFGDARDFIKPGTLSHISSALHAEQDIIAYAARNGLSLSGADLYVTTFPCAICAKLIAWSGFKRLLFKEGHATFDGEQVLLAKNIEIIRVKMI